MHDEAIEEYIRAQAAIAFPDVDAAQMLVLFPSADFGKPRDRRGASIGSETLTVRVIIVDNDKLDRFAFIALFQRQMITVDSTMMEQRFIKTDMMDWIEIVKNKGVIFTLNFIYDL